MRNLEVPIDGDKYRYQIYRYDNLEDAIRYALLDRKRRSERVIL